MNRDAHEGRSVFPRSSPGSTGADADLRRTAAVIPALNEAENVRILLPELKALGLGQIIVADNGSRDETARIARSFGARLAYEAQRGYGAACAAGLSHLDDAIEVVAFMDADLSVDVAMIGPLVEPILRDEADFVLGVRSRESAEPGAMTFPQRVANRLFPWLIRWGWGYLYLDMSPFRAVRRSGLSAMDLHDRAYGWTIEMQIRAVEEGLRIAEIQVPYRRRRHGTSKVSGSIRGVMRAAYGIVRTWASLWITKRRRRK